VEVKSVPLQRRRFPESNNSSLGKPEGSPESPYIEKCVERIWPVKDKSFLVYISDSSTIGKRFSQYLHIAAKDLQWRNMSDRRAVPASELWPVELQGYISQPLGYLNDSKVDSVETGSEDRFTFLDHNGWVCTIPLTDANGRNTVNRHFLLPRPWMVADCLTMSIITQRGVFLCPKDGEVGLVQNGFRRVFQGS